MSMAAQLPCSTAPTGHKHAHHKRHARFDCSIIPMHGCEMPYMQPVTNANTSIHQFMQCLKPRQQESTLPVDNPPLTVHCRFAVARAALMLPSIALAAMLILTAATAPWHGFLEALPPAPMLLRAWRAGVLVTFAWTAGAAMLEVVFTEHVAFADADAASPTLPLLLGLQHQDPVVQVGAVRALCDGLMLSCACEVHVAGCKCLGGVLFCKIACCSWKCCIGDAGAAAGAAA